MKVLFDANTPAPLARFLSKHEVSRADLLGWQGLVNGELLKAASDAGFDVLVTCDQNIQYQQNLTGCRVALVVLSSNHWPTLRRWTAKVASAIDFAQAGQVIQVDIPRT